MYFVLKKLGKRIRSEGWRNRSVKCLPLQSRGTELREAQHPHHVSELGLVWNPRPGREAMQVSLVHLPARLTKWMHSRLRGQDGAQRRTPVRLTSVQTLPQGSKLLENDIISSFCPSGVTAQCEVRQQHGGLHLFL